jgi:hypothetical protein
MSKDQIQIYYFREIFAFEIDTKCKGGRLALIYQDVCKDS